MQLGLGGISFSCWLIHIQLESQIWDTIDDVFMDFLETSELENAYEQLFMI